MYTRHVLPLLNEALADTPVVLLNGARQTGKSTLAQSLSAENSRRYLTLDDHVTLAAAKCNVVVGQRYSAPPRLLCWLCTQVPGPHNTHKGRVFFIGIAIK